MRRAFGVCTALAFVFATALSGVGNANPGVGVGLAPFHCQVTVLLPVAAKTAAADTCDGGANGVAVSATGKTDVALSTSDSSVINKGLDNLKVYNIEYSEICPVPGVPEPPPTGSAQGYAWIAGTGVLSGAPSYVHTGFQYERIGVVFVALLEHPKAAPGTTTPHAHNGAPTDHKAHAATGGLGVAAGVFAAKAPIGNCAGALPTEVVIHGVVAAVVGDEA